MSIRSWVRFAEVWNDISKYTTVQDVANALGTSVRSCKTKASKIRKAYKQGNKDAPALIGRNTNYKVPLVDELLKTDHEYTPDELINILRHLKLLDPNKFITQNSFQAATSIPRSSWSHIFGTFAEFIRQSGLALNRQAHQLERNIAVHVAKDHYREANFRHDWSNDFVRESNADFQTYVVCSDLHDIDCDPFYLRVLIDTVLRVRPDKLILNGDILDCTEFGRYNIDPREWDVVGRIKYAHEHILKPLREAMGDGQIDFIEGNHELRILKHLCDQTPALRAVLADLHGWDIRKLLGLDQFEINYISKADLSATNKSDIKKELTKNYKIYHDCFMAAHYPFYRNRGLAGMNGHHHRVMMWTVPNQLYGTQTWLQNGCGHKLQADYCDGEDWQLSFGIVDIHVPTKSVNIQNVPITHIAQVGGKYYERTTEECVGRFTPKDS